MEPRDRLLNLGLFVAAAAGWGLVWLLVTSRDPFVEPQAGYVGALLIGLAVALSGAPLAWLAVFARHRRISYRGDWLRAARRGAWLGFVVSLFVVLRVMGVLSLPIVLFVVVIVALAEATLSVER